MDNQIICPHARTIGNLESDNNNIMRRLDELLTEVKQMRVEQQSKFRELDEAKAWSKGVAAVVSLAVAGILWTVDHLFNWIKK